MDVGPAMVRVDELLLETTEYEEPTRGTALLLGLYCHTTDVKDAYVLAGEMDCVMLVVWPNGVCTNKGDVAGTGVKKRHVERVADVVLPEGFETIVRNVYALYSGTLVIVRTDKPATVKLKLRLGSEHVAVAQGNVAHEHTVVHTVPLL
jgi:hypothetical protein